MKLPLKKHDTSLGKMRLPLVRLKTQDNGVWAWTINNVPSDTALLEVANALREGLTIEETAQKTGLTKSQVETRKKKAKQQNLL